MIQCLSSHDLPGKTKDPLNVVPAASEMVSPHCAELSADCSAAGVLTRWTAPGAGVSASELLTYARGNSAGPSKFPVLEVETLNVSFCDTVWPAASVTSAVIANAPDWLVMPLIAPWLALKANPDGSEPESFQEWSSTTRSPQARCVRRALSCFGQGRAG